MSIQTAAANRSPFDYFDSDHNGVQGVTGEDRSYRGSRYAEVRDALFRNPYYVTWGAPDEPALPVWGVTLGRALAHILPGGKPWRFRRAAERALDSPADLRWGKDGRGFRRILHPNGVCLFGRWEIDSNPEGVAYTGYFAPGSRGLLVGRYSTCCSETRNGFNRSLSLVGKLYPTTDENHSEPLETANFITQEDLGGSRTGDIKDAWLRNAPNTTPSKRGFGLPTFLVTGLLFAIVDRQPTVRQLYPIAELGKPAKVKTCCPQFMQLEVAREPVKQDGEVDFRDEVLGEIYDKGDPEPKRQLVFDISVTDEGSVRGLLNKRRSFGTWHKIGRIVFEEAVASYNGDFVLHFHHPPWRNDRNDPETRVRAARR
ncbi:MAG: hypothetical protein RL885_12870 [Planctomycetota bacterium]